MYKPWMGWAALVVGIIVLLVILAASGPNAGSGEDVERGRTVAVSIEEGDWTKGNGPVEIVEYSDFQCPACQAFSPFVERAIQEFGDDITFAYRHFPLPSHQHATIAAQAAEAAGRQGKFFEMHDELFANQREWGQSTNPTELFTTYAENIGLNLEQFTDDLTSNDVRNAVQDDRRSGARLSLRGTPGIIVDGVYLSANPGSYAQFKQIIEEALDARGVESTTTVTESSNTSSSPSYQVKPANE